MKAFLERYFDAVNEALGLPETSITITKDKKLELLETSEAGIWEDILAASGPESTPGYTEVSFPLTANQAFYRLPGNFRQFEALERWESGDRDRVYAVLPSIAPEEIARRGVRILTSEQGLLVRPCPTTDQTDWMLKYQKGPVILHYAKAAKVNPDSLVADPASVGAGQLVTVNNYYTGSFVRVYKADSGAPQTVEVTAYVADPPTFYFRHSLNPTPKGETWYEIQPLLPRPHDQIYALDSAINVLAGRGPTRKRRELIAQRERLWGPALGVFLSTVSDRPTSRPRRLQHPIPDSGSETLWG